MTQRVQHPPQFEHAQLDWDDQGRPLSSVFDDVYFSPQQGIEETRHVFLHNNDLAQRFGSLADHQHLTIAETGFGTGLNFFCAWQLFEQHAPPSARLHFVSVEKYPLSHDDLQRALSLWPELAPVTQPLLAQYVAIHPGFQRLQFDNGRITLDLLIGDASEMLSQLDARVDAWFLDGFAPAKNPEMWSTQLFAEIARLSVAGTTLGSFTSAGDVRRALKDVGFKIKRVPGIGGKWHVLRGQFIGPQEQSTDALSPPSTSPIRHWFSRPPLNNSKRHALVIGAGLAGCATAASLAARGWQVSLLERHKAIAQEASGNPQGVLYLKLSAHGTALSRLIVSGFGYTRRLLERLDKGQDWSDCGVLQLAFNSQEHKRQTKLAAAFPPGLLQQIDQTTATQLAGIELPAGGLFYPDAGWVHPPALCELLSRHPNISLLSQHNALQLVRVDNQWQAWDGEQLLASAEVAVLAGAAEIKHFAQSAELPLKRIRGQISSLKKTAASGALSTVVCAQGYIAPARLTEHTLGASFDFDSDDLSLNSADHIGNLQMLEEISPDLSARLNVAEQDPQSLAGRAAFRCTSPDYLPIVGPLADQQAFLDSYNALSKNAKHVPDTPCPWLEGLYINSGHGSRGLITAALSGELIAAWLNDEPLPVPRDVAEGCHPNRFALRKLIRNL
ncbi:bifunctional tRNA (5-methylaminomethyl-2-thiouridine)(34)-methyltransferase MnmD/FAD-dependent 5-carboxymethylaminomethyl-2-thiouridine(34) oxidoreductase MnmC [Pseudomonas sp. EL_65y_Pfl2_R95]|uniref:bifunctional tRNA (5-methylaminomethyl-2-thiouridine)(34)-methyltransferase MnmD/FAD-dependent 5-carboxymethylaminomethyl-2-thiouridine(34) oxidoreductase MnmC n=1 Tax=Pseudomonas sp. EL_65y_Pfl2_R95 TaxID=3088698 RepID=UPI0030DC9304